MADIFNINAELEAAAAAAAQLQRGRRPTVPVPFGNILPLPSQFGPTIAPYISDFQMLGLPAANRAINLIANGVAEMTNKDGSLDCFKPDGITKVDPTPPICVRPNASITAHSFWHQAIAQWGMRGNFLAIKADFDSNGYPRQCVPVPLSISYAVYEGGLPVYYIGGQRYEADEVIHVPNFLVPGSPWGIGYVAQFRRAIAMQLDQQHMAGDTYSRGSIPSLAITTDAPRQTTDRAKEIQADWIANQGAGVKTPAVLPEGWKIERLEWNPEDMQFLASREFSVAEMALMFNLDPSDLGAGFAAGGTQQTYANIEQRTIGRQTDAYGPIARRFEQAWSDVTPGGNYARFVRDASLNLDAKTRAEVHQLNIVTQVETVDEARAMEGKKPLPKEEIIPPTDPFESPKQEGVADVKDPAFDISDNINPAAAAGGPQSPSVVAGPRTPPATSTATRTLAACPLCGDFLHRHDGGKCP